MSLPGIINNKGGGHLVSNTHQWEPGGVGVRGWGEKCMHRE